MITIRHREFLFHVVDEPVVRFQAYSFGNGINYRDHTQGPWTELGGRPLYNMPTVLRWGRGYKHDCNGHQSSLSGNLRRFRFAANEPS